MSEAEYYWPSEDQPGKYTLKRRAGDEKDWEWDGAKWRRGIWFRDTSQMIEWGGYLGVRREPATDIEDDGHDDMEELIVELGAAERKFDHLRKAVKAIYEAAHWTADRPCDEAGLWERLRDEAEIEPGNSPRPVNAHKPTPKTITPDPDDSNAMVAQQALDEWRACKQQPKAADWAYRWAVELCERLGAR